MKYSLLIMLILFRVNCVMVSEEGHAVYARNLPMNATPIEIEELFKKFGEIKPGGVQVRNHRVCIFIVKFCKISMFVNI